jgi:CDP-diacylglycerol--glycerol-3-phosphate 3-phosphatidyltransferase
MSTRSVHAVRRRLPNALTLLRLVALPVFVWLLLDDRVGPSWPAGVLFGAAGVTDQLDGWLARRWRAESRFGKIADPLADRLMIGLAVVLLIGLDRLPWAAALLLVRDLTLMIGYKLVAPRGYEFEVNQLGKIATWGLYASVGFVLVTEKGTVWPLVCFWINLALAIAAAALYLRKARHEVGPPEG